MAFLVVNGSSNYDNPVLDIYIRKNGALIDPYSLEYIIYDTSDASKQITPEQVYPSTGRATVDLDTYPAGQKLSTGRFFATWTVPAAEPVGSHRIEWFFKETSTGPENTFSEEFEVFAEEIETVATYIEVQDIRDVGIDSSIASDAEVLAKIKIAQQFIERATRQWFAPRDVTFKVDGNNSDTLFFSVPIISVDYLKINNSTDELSADLYTVYNGIEYPDDRKNPKICLNREGGSIFSRPSPYDAPMVFRKGRQNQEVSGTFGYIEANGSTPELIKRAVLKLTVQNLTLPVYVAEGSVPPAAPPAPSSGQVMREITDGHSIQYTFVKFSDVRSGLSGVTPDREVLDIIRLYKAPIGIAVPTNWL